MSDTWEFPDGVDQTRIGEYERRVLFQAVMFSRLRELAMEHAELQRRVGRLEDVCDELRTKNREMRKRLEESKGVIAGMSQKERQTVIISRSSCDPLRLIEARSRDYYVTPATSANTAIEFTLCEKVKLLGARLTSAHAHFLSSYRLVAGTRRGDEVVFTIDNDDELHGDGAQVTRHFTREVTASTFRIEQTGPAGDGGNSFALRNVELLADGFENGFFRERLRRDKPPPFEVTVTTEGIDPRTGRISARTLPGRRQWIELEFTGGRVRVEGFSARGGHRFTLRGIDGDRWDDLAVEPAGALAGIEAFKVTGPARRFGRIRVVPAEGDDPMELADFDLIGGYQSKSHS
jgi:hypothetical protein